MSELPKTYRPSEHEDRIRARWTESKAFAADPGRVLSGEARPYCVLIPPPNVTARLHLGHALNNTLQDVVVRVHRMRGFETLWMPGTDHAGIATQAVVERRLWEEEKKRRTDLGRDAFVSRVQAWKDEYERVITDQLKLMGCSCDWDRQRFTMDPICARAVREAFSRLFREGLIYRGKRLVNWDPTLQTAVADDECYDEEVQTSFWSLRYPLVHAHGASTRKERLRGEMPPKDAVPVTWSELAARGYPDAEKMPGEEPAWLTVATTRPETYLGDTAVAVNPHDPRAKALRGLCVELPLVGRVIPIVEDAYVVLPERYARTDEEASDPKAAYATGFLKVTPAHDRNDYELYQRHKAVIDTHAGRADGGLCNMMSPDGRVSDSHGWSDVGSAHLFVGKTMAEARKMVVAEFKAHGLLEAVKPYTQTQTFSERSKAQIEPYLSDQWYVRVTDPRMAARANASLVPEQRSGGAGGAHQAAKAVEGDGAMRFYPARYARTFEQWHDHIRDWCISRQLWWGHRIPIWWSPMGCDGPPPGLDPAAVLVRRESGRLAACVRSDADADAIAALERAGWRQDEDVLDTWFSSALWPLSTLGWPDPAKAAEDAGDPSLGSLLRAFNPTSVLCTAREIITLWVSRMTMFNRVLLGQGADSPGPVPFRDVYIHCVVQDGEGQKMSKSLGNGVDPLDIIHTHGSDAMRFTLCHIATQTQDVRLPVDILCPHCGEMFTPKMITNTHGDRVAAPVQEHCGKKLVSSYGLASGEARPTADTPAAKNSSSKFDLGRNFANKLWNASRFALSILGRAGPGPAVVPGPDDAWSTVDRWMISRLASSVRAIDAALANYEFSVYAQSLYRLVWDDFCDWYLEAIKPTVASSPLQQATLRCALDTILRLAHPVMPYITEAIHEQLREISTPPTPWISLAPPRKGGLLCTAGWPRVSNDAENLEATRAFERVQALVTAVREVRAQHNVPPKRRITLHAPASQAAGWDSSSDLVSALSGLETLTGDPPGPGMSGRGSVAFHFEGHEYRLTNLADAVDAGAEKARLTKLVTDLEKSVATLSARLANPGYADRAPPAMVAQTRGQLAKAEQDLDAARKSLATLGV